MGDKSKILAIDDDALFIASINLCLGEEYDLLTANNAQTAMQTISQSTPDIILMDVTLPDISGLELLKMIKRRNQNLPVIMLTGHADAETIIEAMKAGANDYVIKGGEEFAANLKFRISQCLELSSLVRKNQVLANENNAHIERNKKLSAKLAEECRSYEILGNSSKTLQLKSDILKLKGTKTFVLITGENGTGKELVARNINLQEDDHCRPLIIVNCAAVPANLFESEFFGHAKGAFTGATDNKVGQFKLADGGDIFLDEIGEIPLDMQAKLLRVLEDQTFTPVGSVKPVHVHVRVIAATNRNLEEEVQKGRFREDLYYRLNRFTIYVPPLRERKEDIIPLAEEFLRRYLPVAKFSEPAKKVIVEYPWRGNIRELQNSIERAAVMVRGSSRPIVKVEHLALSKLGLIPDCLKLLPLHLLPKSKDEISSTHLEKAMNWLERIYLDRGLKLFNGDNEEFFKKLGLSRATYFRKKRALHVGDPEPQSDGRDL